MDTLVIGGGLAGVAAAQRLASEGRMVALLEARDRLGGRILTERVPGSPWPIELGPEWVGPDGPVDELLGRIGAHLYAASGSRLRRRAGKLENLDQIVEVSDSLIARALEASDGDPPLAAAIARCCSGADEAAGRELLFAYIEGFHAADPARVSLQWLGTVERNQPADASELRVLDGVDHLLEALVTPLVDPIVLQLNTVVREIRWQPGGVEVIADCMGTEQVYHADQAIVTLPVGVLQAGDVRFTPELGARKPSLARLAMGEAVKIVFRMDRSFWRDQPGLGDLLFLHAFDQAVPTWWTMHPTDIPLITGWAAGPQVARLETSGEESLLAPALDSLAVALALSRPEVERHVEAWHSHDWQRDPFARGAYSYPLAGGAGAHEELGLPLDDTLFFAGEATAPAGFNATMAGAIQSGWRAADQLLAIR